MTFSIMREDNKFRVEWQENSADIRKGSRIDFLLPFWWVRLPSYLLTVIFLVAEKLPAVML